MPNFDDLISNDPNCRRDFNRFRSRRAVRVVVLNADNQIDHSLTCYLQDLSAGGCSFQIPEPMDPGANMVLAFDRKDGSTVVSYAVCRLSRPADERWYLAGVEFQKAPEGVDPTQIIAHWGQAA